MHILLVEDDRNLSLGVEYALKSEGFAVTPAATLAEARRCLEQSFDLVLLDVMLPDGTGYELCREIRSRGSTPVIFLTACDDEVNVVMGLDIGGDDYMTKPFRVKELVSRIRAVARRTGAVTKDEGGLLASGPVTVNTLECRVSVNDGDVQLTALEYRLLLALVSNPRQVLARGRLLELLWDSNGEFVDDNALSVYVRRLREKLEANPEKPALITTARGIGYKWEEEVRRL